MHIVMATIIGPVCVTIYGPALIAGPCEVLVNVLAGVNIINGKSEF